VNIEYLDYNDSSVILIPHEEIFELISGPRQNQCLSKRKKEIGETDAAYESPKKRIPNRLTMHGTLSTEKYAQTVRSWRSWVSNGEQNQL